MYMYTVPAAGILNIRFPVLAVSNRKPKSKDTTNCYNPVTNPNHIQKTYFLLQFACSCHWNKCKLSTILLRCNHRHRAVLGRQSPSSEQRQLPIWPPL